MLSSSLLKKKQTVKKYYKTHSQPLRQGELAMILKLLNQAAVKPTAEYPTLEALMPVEAKSPHGLILHLVSLYPPPIPSVARKEMDGKINIKTLSTSVAGQVIKTHLNAVKDPLLTVGTFFTMRSDIVKPENARGKVMTVKGESSIVVRNLKKKRDRILSGRQFKRCKTNVTRKKLDIDPNYKPITIVTERRKNYFFPPQIGMGVTMRVGGNAVTTLVKDVLNYTEDGEDKKYSDSEGGLPSLKLKAMEDIVRTLSSRYVLNDEKLQTQFAPALKELTVQELGADATLLERRLLLKTPTSSLSKYCISKILRACISLDSEEGELKDLNADILTDRSYYDLNFVTLEAGSKAERNLRGMNAPVGKDPNVTRKTVLEAAAAAELEANPPDVIEEPTDEDGKEGLKMARRLLKLLDNRGLAANITSEIRDIVATGLLTPHLREGDEIVEEAGVDQRVDAADEVSYAAAAAAAEGGEEEGELELSSDSDSDSEESSSESEDEVKKE
jgi:hypothetical protein